MCNKPILRLHSDAPQGAEGPMDPEEVWTSRGRREKTPFTENTHIKYTREDEQKGHLEEMLKSPK